MDKLSDVQIRIWYKTHNADIPNRIDTTAPLEEQARQAHGMRNMYRAQARSMMQDRKAAAMLEITDPNEDFETFITHKIKAKGMTREEALRYTISSAARTNRRVNTLLGLEDDENV